VKLIKAGVFRDVDAAMMCHGWDRWILHQDLLGIVRVAFEFTGRAAHAAADPWEGVNALDAVIQTFNNVAMLRQQVKPSARIHGIVTNGGAAPNIITESAACLFYVRAADLSYMWELHGRVVACAEGAAKATGATLKVLEYGDSTYEPMKRNETLLEAFRLNLRAIGEAETPEVKDRLGSSDVGNVSQVIPCIQPLMKIAPDGTPIHSRAFEAAAATPLARAGTLAAAKAMARTTYDLLADPSLLMKAKQEHKGGSS